MSLQDTYLELRFGDFMSTLSIVQKGMEYANCSCIKLLPALIPDMERELATLVQTLAELKQLLKDNDNGSKEESSRKED